MSDPQPVPVQLGLVVLNLFRLIVTAITSTYLPLLTGMADKAPLSFQSIFSLNRGLIMKALPQAATTAAAAS